MPDTHNERGGDADPYDWDPVYAAATIAELRKQLAAATARAESATVLPERWRALIAERDAAVDAWSAQQDIIEAERRRAEKAEARLAELGEPETEQRIIGDSGLASTPTQFDLEHRADWCPGVRLEERQVYATPWCVAPDAAQEARSATLRAEDGVQASGSELEFGSGAAGLSEPKRPREADSVAIKLSDGEIRVPEDCPIPDDALRAMNVMNDDTTEDDRD